MFNTKRITSPCLVSTKSKNGGCQFLCKLKVIGGLHPKKTFINLDKYNIRWLPWRITHICELRITERELWNYRNLSLCIVCGALKFR